MNKELLLKVKDQILKEPKQFFMGSWFSTQFDASKPIWPVPNCGTSACIAGWAVALNAKKNPNLMAEHYNATHDSIESDAMQALEISYQDAQDLFFASYWPMDLRDRYQEMEYKDNAPEELAKIAAERIDRFIAETEKAES